MEEKNNGFFKGFWVGFGVFLICAVLIGGVMLMQGIKGFERWRESHETEAVRPTKPSDPAKPTDPARPTDPAAPTDPAGTGEAGENAAAAKRFEEVMDYVDTPGTLSKGGEPITFGACEKHRIKGVAVPGNLWKIFYAPGIIEADEWVEVDGDPIIVE